MRKFLTLIALLLAASLPAQAAVLTADLFAASTGCDATSGNQSDTLPAATGTRRIMVYQKIDATANTCTLTRAGSDTIQGATSVVASARWQTYVLQDSGTGTWRVITAPALGALPNGVLITGLVRGNGASAPSAYAGTSCTNQFPRSLDLNGAATCASVAIGSDVSGLGTGVATFLAQPSSANLLAALTTKTGTGNSVFDTAPVFPTTLMLGASTALTLATGEHGYAKVAASGSAPGAAGAKESWVCGTGAGTAKKISYAGTSTTPVNVVDNVGTGVTGC